MKAARKEIIQAGKLLFTKVTARKKSAPQERARKRKPTSSEVMAINQKNAERDLSIKLHANFGPGDLHLVLTYSGDEPTKEDARKKLSKFKRDAAKVFQKHGLTVKWIEATEYQNKRIHHHIVMNRIPVEEIVKIWPHGFVRPTWLDETGDYRALVSYLIKETSKTFRNPDAFSKRRFNCSRSIVVPDAKVEEVSAAQLFEPRAAKGFYVDQDTVYKGINLATDRPYIEYIQISLEEEPRKYRRGKKQKYIKEKYIRINDEEEQMGLF